MQIRGLKRPLNSFSDTCLADAWAAVQDNDGSRRGVSHRGPFCSSFHHKLREPDDRGNPEWMQRFARLQLGCRKSLCISATRPRTETPQRYETSKVIALMGLCPSRMSSMRCWMILLYAGCVKM